MKTSTSTRLALALKDAGAPPAMYERAAFGYYDDFQSPLTFPKIALFDDLLRAGLKEFANRVILGEFDSTDEEMEEWMRGKSTKELDRKRHRKDGTFA